MPDYRDFHRAVSSTQMSALADYTTHGATAVGVVPVGGIVMWAGLLANIPTGWALCDGTNGTPDLRDRFLVGAAAGQNPGTTGGANNHTPAGTVSQPTFAGAALDTHSHGTGTLAASAHAGAAVGDHAVTQPGAHAAHVFTQPGAHSNHVVTQPNAHSNHVVTQPANHVVTQPANHSAHAALAGHSHELPFQIPSTTTTRQLASATFGTGTSRAATAVSAAGTANTTSAAVALTQAITGGTPDAHSAHSGTAVDAHSATAVDAHSAHAGAAVDAHTAHSGGAVDAHSAHAGTAVSAHAVTQPSDHSLSGYTTTVSAGTPAGTVSTPTFTGTSADYRPAFYSLAFIQRTV